jgi:heme/copper-type cytochrome/quinol oxidase subunit 2
MKYLGGSGNAVATGATATGVLATTGSELSLMWVTLTILLVVAGVAMVALSKRRERRDKAIVEGIN